MQQSEEVLMLVYSAAHTQTVEAMSKMADQSGQNNFLFSFADDEAKKCARYFCRNPKRRLIIDSGAFSVWSRGEELTLKAYIEFCKEIQATAKCYVDFISLDVIAGSRGVDLLPEPEQSEAACEESWGNYKKMRAAGIPAIPTFHQFDDDKWLFLMAADTDYIAVSPRKSIVNQEEKLLWLRQVFADLGHNPKVHGLGIAGWEMMESFPFFSIDSSAWLQSSKGIFRYFDGRRTVSLAQDEWQSTSQECRWDDGTDAVAEAKATYVPTGGGGNYHFMMRALDSDARLQRFLTHLWQQRGFPANVNTNEGMLPYHLALSSSLYADFRRLGNWRTVAATRGVDPDYVAWAVNLAAQTACWQRYREGKLLPEELADKLGWRTWNGQFTVEHLDMATN